MGEKEKSETMLPMPLLPKVYEVRRAPTVFAMIFVAFGWFCNEVALAWIHERVPRDTNPLPDLWFSFFPEVRGAIRITEYIMLILLVNALVVVFLHQHRWVVARRVFFCAALSYCFRAFCITIFQVPVPSVNTYCAPKTIGGADIVMARVVRMFWSAGIEQLRPRELCGDLIVSGHTLTIFTALYTFKHYAPRKMQVVGHLFHVLAFIALIAILLARKHYMIDVVLGYTVATRVFWEYHALAMSYHENSLERNPLSQVFWSCVIAPFERDAPPPHLFHNRLEWPSSCPQRVRRYLHVV